MGSKRQIHLPAHSQWPDASCGDLWDEALRDSIRSTEHPTQIGSIRWPSAWQWAYSAFGDEKPTIAKNRFANVELNQSFGTTSVPAVTFNLRYPGQYFDQESGLHYNYHRSYSATTGRYTQSDPIGLDGGWNRFGYAAQNPLKFTDPLGLSIWDLITGGGKKKAKDLNCPDTCPTFQTCYACCVAKNMATHDAGTTCQVSCNDTPYPDNPYDPRPANPKPEKK